MFRLEGKMLSIEQSLGIGTSPCTCLQAEARARLAALLGHQVIARGDEADTEPVPEPSPCLADTHHWSAGYRYPAPVDLTRVHAALLELSDLPDPPPAGVVWIERGHGSLSINMAEPAIHRIPGDTGQITYKIRPVEETIRDEGEAYGVEDLKPKPKPLDPLVEAIRKRINALRPKSIEPDDENFESERWLELPTDK